MKPRTIVSVLESSPTANDAALSRALSLAQWYDADLHVLHLRPSRPTTAAAAISDGVVARVTRIAAGTGTTGVNVIPAVLAGPPVRAIADYTSRVGADLVVVGRSARRASGYWSAGSFAAAVGNAVDPPTVAIPGGDRRPEDSGTLFANLLCAIDFSDVSLRALSEALAIARKGEGRLTLLHVLDGFPYEAVYSGFRAFRLKDELQARVARVNRDLRSLVPLDVAKRVEVATVSGRTHEAIVGAAADRRADLVVLGLPRRPRLESFVAGSTARRVLRGSASPVLLVPGSPTERVREFAAAGARRRREPPAGRLPAARDSIAASGHAV